MKLARWLAGAVGLASLIAGTWGVLIRKVGSGSLILVGVGAVLVLVPLLIDRLERISVSNNGWSSACPGRSPSAARRTSCSAS